MNKILEWLWRWLPDRCEMQDCERMGVRGNENRVGGMVMCDYCHSMVARPLNKKNLAAN